MDTARLLASAPATATAVAIIDLGAVAANFCDLRTRHGAPVAGVVKADAYGLSAAHVAPVLVREGAEMLFTAGFDEAAALPDCGPRAVLDGLTPGSERDFVAAAAHVYEHRTEAVYGPVPSCAAGAGSPSSCTLSTAR